ncbi:MAG: serine/threonine-protein kinase, partial [Microcystaceae cyanobacterium]
CAIVHRDIKPSNILVIQDPTLGELVKILDFGIAKLVQSGESQTHSFMGTLAYCSPEQMEGKELDNRSDIYSLGVMMYEMLTGDMPLFPENSSFGGWYEVHHYVKPQAFSPSLKVPSALEDLILWCLAKASKDRPQSIGELLQALESLESNPRENRSNSQSFKPPATPLEKTASRPLPAANEICQQMTWPKDKPQQKIVFPYVIRTSEGTFASLWVMLEQQDIANRISSIRYNQFLFLTTPHPMILWITVLYHRERGPRWLPCYLDLKTSTSQRLTRLLGETGCYWISFFALENPQKCQQTMTSTIAPNQCKMLQEWATTSQMMKAGQPQITKRLLKQELEKLKPKIVLKLETHQSDFPSDISGL